MIRKLIIFTLLLYLPLSISKAQTVEGRVTDTSEPPLYKIELQTGKQRGEEVTVDNPKYGAKDFKLRKGQAVVLTEITTVNGNVYIISDLVRRGGLSLLFAIFAIIAILVGKKHGFYSLLSMTVSFIILINFTLPALSKGGNPTLIILVTCAVLIPITFYMAHGLNIKTHISVIGTFISLVITALLTIVFTNATHLSGLASEEAMFLQTHKDQGIDLRSLLISGIILGTLGILDDVTVSQTSIVLQLKAVNKRLSSLELFGSAMKVGRDHITSMINTLVLVYAGASFPLLILFVDSNYGFNTVINYEIVAEEIVRTLVGSIGLIIAVPITTLIAAVYSQKTPIMDK